MRHVGSDEEMSEAGGSEVVVGTEWEAVGPFPSGMREHPMMASPLSAFDEPSRSAYSDIAFAHRPFVEDETWPSVLGDGGRVGWRKFKMGEDGWLHVSYPDIRWDQLRLDHGWATLGYQVLLRTSLTVPSISERADTHFLMDVVQGVEYAFIPDPSSSVSPEVPTTWYNGDIYAFADSPTGSRSAGKTSNFARSHVLPAGEYILLLRAMYEIRMFGDPGLGKIPIIKIRLSTEVCEEDIRILPGGWTVPQVVDGVFMGDFISMAVRGSPLLQEDIVISPLPKHSLEEEGVEVTVLGEAVILPGQVRPIALRITQTQPLSPAARNRPFEFRFSVSGKPTKATIPLENLSKDRLGPFRITFASPSSPADGQAPSFVSFATVIPPTSFSTPIPARDQNPVILATHGAGVSAESPFWVKEVPARKKGWAVLPMGKNEWGEDWHGGSLADVWAARDILPSIAAKLGWEVSRETLLMGHSNGGQGAWHIAARYPDRIVGMLAASGWLKIEEYVPYTEQTSNHFADPALMGILKSALTPYNNDLYASNLAHIPVLALHGGADDNVPPQHSRTHVALIAAWEGSHRNIKIIEVPQKGHWWEDMLHSEEVTSWIENLPKRESWNEDRRRGFTITCANPDESDGRAGIRILELAVPGRLARLDVNARQWKDSATSPLDLHGSNIRKISMKLGQENEDTQVLIKTNQGFVTGTGSYGVRVYGPLIRFLATGAPIVLVIGSSRRARSIAIRIAHDLYLYHRLSVRIMKDREALGATAQGIIKGNIAVIGMPHENEYLKWMLSQRRIPVHVPTRGVLQINDSPIWERGSGLISLHPHPVESEESSGLAMIITGTDDEGLELAARLFPIRTGVPIPDWAITSPRSKWQGAGGFIGAGFWNGEWGWSEPMSWIDR